MTKSLLTAAALTAATITIASATDLKMDLEAWDNLCGRSVSIGLESTHYDCESKVSPPENTLPYRGTPERGQIECVGCDGVYGSGETRSPSPGVTIQSGTLNVIMK